MKLQQAFGEALRRRRKMSGLSQEDFVKVSGRTYLSELERGLKTPTLDKIDALASTIGIHPISLLAECYTIKDEISIGDLLCQIDKDLTRVEDP